MHADRVFRGGAKQALGRMGNWFKGLVSLPDDETITTFGNDHPCCGRRSTNGKSEDQEDRGEQPERILRD